MEGVMLVPIVHTVHVLAVGAWLGGVLFTTLVVSPAPKAMKWREAERVLAVGLLRSERQG
jgi:uncharacterized membrane protein